MNLNQITLPVGDMKTACNFYLELGFTQIVDTPHYARFQAATGESTFSLSLNEQSFNNGAVIYFEEKQLDKLVETLLAKGITFTQLPQDKRYLWREAELLDPSGNVIKLYWAGENRINPPWKVNITK